VIPNAQCLDSNSDLREMTDDTLRQRFGEFLTKAETGIYGLLAVLLSVTALVTIVNAARILWEGLGQGSVAAQTLRALNEMLIVMMLVETSRHR
jgi:hypothetical protein